MKIVKSIQLLYDSQKSYYKILNRRVDEFINNNKNKGWHYESRIKKIESFSAKIETGRFNKDQIFEDLFACTIVVKNLSEIEDALELVDRFFLIKKRRPRDPKVTHKESFSFPFDDLRLYVSLKDTETGDLSPEIYSLIFEIQIKTFLQHAWSIATHDLIYKSENIHWGKERVAYQIKAVLEHAEITISGIDELSKLSEISKENEDVKRINEIICSIVKHWKEEDLPSDRRRLAQNINGLLKELNINLSELNEILVDEKSKGRGVLTRDLSPYLVVVQSIINQRKEVVERFISRDDSSKKFKLLLTDEIQLADLDVRKRKNIIYVSSLRDCE